MKLSDLEREILESLPLWRREIYLIFKNHKQNFLYNLKFTPSTALTLFAVALIPFLAMYCFYFLGGFENVTFYSVFGIIFIMYYSFSFLFLFVLGNLLFTISSEHSHFDRFEDVIVDYISDKYEKE